MDNVLIFGKDERDMTPGLPKALIGLKIAKPSKCSIRNTSVKFLGHIIGKN